MGKTEMIGKRFGRLIVTRQSENRSGKRKRLMYYCDCDCGKKDYEVVGEALRSGHTKSCGCLKNDTASSVHKKYNTYDLSGEFGIGITSNTNKEFYFDLEDYDKIKNYCWLELDSGYIATNDPDTIKRIYLHRLVLNAKKDDIVDHKEHNLYDNRKRFLRIGTTDKNMMNASLRKDNKSGVTGVYYHKLGNFWVSEIWVNQQKIYLGSYIDKQDAINARREAEEKYFGEWSYKNSTGKYNNESDLLIAN